MLAEHTEGNTRRACLAHLPYWYWISDREEESMKSIAFLERADHTRKAAIYAAAHDGELRNFAYHEELGECRETFSSLLHAVQ
jgi:hypothetical protein